MKRFFLNATLVALAMATVVGCSKQRQWNHEERKAMREALKDYRQMVYLNDLTDAEFNNFTEVVATDLEGDYPVYTTFIEMDGVNDTVDMVVVTTIVDELNADPRNMRHIFPYRQLVAEGILPAGLNYDQQRQFYSCFAGKVNSSYSTTTQFFNAVMADTTATSRLAQLQSQCASDLFQWVVTEIEIVEPTSTN